MNFTALCIDILYQYHIFLNIIFSHVILYVLCMFHIFRCKVQSNKEACKIIKSHKQSRASIIFGCCLAVVALCLFGNIHSILHAGFLFRHVARRHAHLLSAEASAFGGLRCTVEGGEGMNT